MELAAVVVVPGPNDLAFQVSQPLSLSSGVSPAVHSSLLPVLGNDVLRTWTERIYKLGVPRFMLTSEAETGAGGIASALSRLAHQGISRLLTIQLKSYAEMDLVDLLQFHTQKRNSITEAHDSRGQLGVSVFDRSALSATGKLKDKSASDAEGMNYPFHGYAKRILSATERQELVGDALTGGCAMRPIGEEIGEKVWVGQDVQLDESVRVIGPTYIGDRVIVRAGATIGPFTSVERDCLVDCGATIESATILPRTYLASGILIRHALVDGGYLEDLRCGAIADLLPSGLAGRVRRRGDRVRCTTIEPEAQVCEKVSDEESIPEFGQGNPPWCEMQL